MGEYIGVWPYDTRGLFSVISSASTRFAERVSYISSSRMRACLAQDWQNQHDDSWKITKGLEIPNKG